MMQLALVELLLQAEEAPAGGPMGGGLGSLLVPMAAIFFIFYLLVWRPEGKKRKARQLMISNVKKGDSIVTTGGLLGKVWKVEKNEVVVIIDKDNDVKVRFAKSAVFEVLPEEEGGKGVSEETSRGLEERTR
jgi:preprotein translocase subunit YajC